MRGRSRDQELVAAEEICQAIKTRALVKLRYEYDRMERLFAPYAIYESVLGNIIVYGFQLRDPGKPLDNEQLRYFALRRLRTIQRTDAQFQPPASFSSQGLRGCQQLILAVNTE